MTHDGGLARERTAIARGRTALSAAALAVLVIKLGALRESPLEIAGGVGFLVCSATLALSSRARYLRGTARGTAVTLSVVLLEVLAAGTLGLIGAFV